jgi:alpha-N-arabinofuranosidase
MFRHSDEITASCATGGLRLLTDITGDAVGFPAEGVVMKLLQRRFLNAVPIGVDGDSPQRKVYGTDYMDKGPTPTGSPTYPLDVLAEFSGDRKRFLMSVVNPTEDGHSFTPRIGALRLRETGKLYQIALSVNSANEAGKEAVVKIDETEQAGMPETTRVHPVSINLYEFEVETA